MTTYKNKLEDLRHERLWAYFEGNMERVRELQEEIHKTESRLKRIKGLFGYGGCA